MAIKLYELAGAEDNRRFCPSCWRIRFVLGHKQLEFETVACRFTDKVVIAFSGQDKVVGDGDEVVSESWAIACYVEWIHPARPSPFGGSAGQLVDGGLLTLSNSGSPFDEL